MARTLAIDYGRKRIGLALSDAHKILASPFSTVEAAQHFPQTIARLLEAIKAYEVDEIVVGVPYSMNGSSGEMAQEVALFVEALKKATSAQIILWDERLTSAQAERVMRDAQVNRKKRAKVVDQLSAVIILQTFLGQKSNSLLAPLA